MTVSELIKKLQELEAEGKGSYLVTGDGCVLFDFMVCDDIEELGLW